jgi:periplasmic protein CpxP/Spy
MKGSTNKILVIAVVLLLATNIALVAFMMTGKSKRSEKNTGRKSTSDMMARELNMTEEQKKNHKLSKEEHIKKIKPLFDSIRLTKAALYSLLRDSTVSDSTINAYAEQIGQTQTTIEKLTFAHFKRKRNLFTAEQQPKYDSFVLRMMQGGKKDTAAKKGK